MKVARMGRRPMTRLNSPTGVGGTFPLPALGDLTDVDTTTTPPTDGDVLTWVDADSQWEPVASGSGVTLSDDTPLVESGMGDAGVSTEASRSDHVHPDDGGGPGGGGGADEYITTLTASSSTQLDFTSFDAAYIAYRFIFADILPGTDSTQFLMRVGTGAGPTYDTGNNYTYANVQSDNTGGSGTRASTGTSAFELGNSWNNTANRGGSGEIVWYRPDGGTNHPHYTQNHSRLAAGSEISSNGGGRYLSTTAITGIRFLFSSGNIASGNVYVYGVKDS